MKAIVVRNHGGPEVLTYEDVEIRQPGSGEIRVRNRAIGVNYTDIYARTGAFNPPELPFIPGKEGAGEVISVGPDVYDFSPGDRVAYVESMGAYAEEHVVPAHFAVHLPDSIDFKAAAAMMLKGLTAQFLLRRTFHVEARHTILVHAAAGGVGSILTQWAKSFGATVIGTVGSPEKREIAYKNGCDFVIDYHKEDVATRVKEITNGEGCHVVYDGIGKATFSASLDSLRPFGYFVNFGLASGPIDSLDISILAEKGSLFATFPVLTEHLAKQEDVLSMSDELFHTVSSGAVKIQTPAHMSLAEASQAHRKLESRQTTGVMILLP